MEELDEGLWVAALETGRLQGLEVDPGYSEEVRWGSIYWGKVTRIDKALDAAFVNLDGDNEGLLHNADVRLIQKDGTILKGGSQSIAKILTPGQMVGVQAKSGFLPHPDEFDFMHEEKLPKLSMDITLPGRYLVHAPMMGENQVSSRIRDKKLRAQLLDMLGTFQQLTGMILRAAAADTQTGILMREGKILKSIWDQLQPFFSGTEQGLIMDGPDAFQRTIGDHSGTFIERIEVVTMEKFKLVEEWCEIFAPDLVPKIKPIEIPNVDSDLALFDYRGILGDIENIFQEYAVLPSGGSIILQPTAALTAIDVNRGADTRPALAVNLEAAYEVARHIRLRNLGGIIVIDFLKLTKKDEKTQFLKKLEDIFDSDPCTVQVHGLTALGLVELTRKRRTPPLQERLDSVESLQE